MKPKIDKESFLHILSHLSKEEINELIESKGKEPKLIRPIVYIK